MYAFTSKINKTIEMHLIKSYSKKETRVDFLNIIIFYTYFEDQTITLS